MIKIIKRPMFWLGLIIGLQVLVNIVWLSIDKTPPAWDQAAHIRSVVLANRGGNLAEMVKLFGGYPPLIYWLGGLWTLLVGVGIDQITLINTLFLIAAIIGVYKLAGNRVLPAVIFSLMPVIYDGSRNMLLDLPLLVWVVCGLYFWVKKNNWGVLLMLILASLTKLNGFIYFVPIILFYLFGAIKSRKLFLRLVGDGLVYLMAVGWWWGIDWQNIYQYITGLAGTGEKLTDPMDLWSGVTWIHYYRLFFLDQVGPILAIMATISWFKIQKTEENKKLIWWAVVVYLIFTVIHNKDFRFTMPILTVVAVWVGVCLDGLRQKVFIYLLLVYLVFNYVENSFGWPIKKPVIWSTPTFLIGDVNWINFSDYPVRAVSSTDWPNKSLVKDMISANGGVKSTVLILTDNAEINDNNLKLYRDLLTDKGDQTLEIHSVYAPGFSDWQNYNMVLVGESKVEPAPFYATNLEYLKQARDYVWQNQDKFEKIRDYYLPNRHKLFLFRILVK